jgi:hypothetical protein
MQLAASIYPENAINYRETSGNKNNDSSRIPGWREVLLPSHFSAT